MQLITSNLLGELTLIPINNHIIARHQSLVETPDDIQPVFILVEEGDDITGPDYAIVSSVNGLLGEGDLKSPQYFRPYELVSYLPELNTYELLFLVCGEDGYWIYIEDSIANANTDLKYMLTATELGGLDPVQPF
jgi:hypothetical protein